MAVHFDGVDGNHNVCVDGAFNAGGPVATGAYTPKFSGATALTIAFTLQPDSLSGFANLSQVTNGGVSYYRIYTNGAGGVSFLVFDANQNFRTFDSAPGVLVAGVPNRLMFRWRAAPESFVITNNGVVAGGIAGTPSGNGGTPITALIAGVIANNAPLELGSASGIDGPCVPGIYQQWAIWAAYLPDADATNYGTNGNPGILSQTGLYWIAVAQADIAPIQIPGAAQSGAYPVGHAHDGWSGFEYGSITATYNYGGSDFQWPTTGVFGVGPGGGASVVADLGVAIPPPPIPWYRDPTLPVLPQRGLEEWEQTGVLTVRSTNAPLLVPSVFATVQAAWNAAQFGDDIVISHTATTLTANLVPPPTKTVTPSTVRNPPRGRTPITGRVTLTGHTPITGHVPITGTSRDPAYIRFMSDAVASLPGIVRRPITGLPATDPPQWVSDAPGGGSCRIQPSHLPNMARLNCDPNGTALLIGSAPQQSVLGRLACYLYFQGLDWNSSVGNAVMWITGDNASANPSINNATRYGPDVNSPHHIIFNQCSWRCDTGNVGTGGSKWLEVEGQYIAVINSRMDNWFETGGGENNLVHWNGDDWGPLIWENNEVPLARTQAFLTGGGSSLSIGVQCQDNVWSRNWEVCPATWRVDTVRRVYTVQFTGTDASTIHYVTGGFSGGFPDPGGGYQITIQYGCIMYEPATGKARRVGPGNAFPNGTAVAAMGLQAAWPSPSFGTSIIVYFQMPEPCIIYNSGLDGSDFTTFTDVPRATVSNGSTAVTFSSPLPVDVQVGHFFYLNNLHWDDFATGSPTNNAFGSLYGITYANCRRKKITAIAGNRLSCTLENPYIVLAGEPTTFPFTVSLFDGLMRPAYLAGKGSWETKCAASRTIMQGDVFEFQLQSGTNHLLVNMAGVYAGGTFTCSNDVVTVPGNVNQGFSFPLTAAILRRTFNPRGWPYNGAETVYPYMVITPSATVSLSGGDFWGIGRIATGTDFANTITLEPLNGSLNTASVFGNGGPFPYNYGINGSPWWTIRGFTYRYNLHIGGGAGATSVRIGNNEESAEMTKGYWANYHDNIYLLGNELANNFGGGYTAIGMNVGCAPGPSGFGTFTTCLGQTSQDTSLTRCSHSTFAHMITAQGGSWLMQTNIGGGQATVQSHDMDLSDNLVTGANGSLVIFAAGSGNPANINQDWTLDATCRSARNVIAGTGAPGAVTSPSYRGFFPDNAGVPTVAAAGFAGFTSVDATPLGQTLSRKIVTGQVDPTDITKYALADIYSTGTVDISPDGLTVTIESGAFPITVQPGQFFKTSTNQALVPIATVPASLDPRWQVGTGWAQGWGLNGDGTISPLAVNAWTSITRSEVLNANQWIEADCTGTNFLGLMLRAAAPTGDLNGMNAYVLAVGTTFTIYKLTPNLLTTLQTGAAPSYTAGTHVRFEVTGTTLNAYIGPTLSLVCTATDSTFASGRCGVAAFVADPRSLKVGKLTAGNMPSTQILSDTFPGTFTSFTLLRAYPETNVTGKSYVITFKGTATDGTDPGANLVLAEQFYRNVRTRAIP